jgi:hypothetical protein
MLKVKYSGNDFKKIEKEVLRAFDFVYKYFLIKIPNITVNVYTTRSEFDKHLKTPTADWFVANASNNNEIDILSPLAMERESSHKKDEFLPILKHEFTHLFVRRVANGGAIPRWLNEGLSAYIAKQHQQKEKTIYIENNFCKKLSTPKDWDKNVKYSAYTIAALFVSFLIKKYSLLKIKKLLSSLDKNYYYQNFEKLFFKVYKINLNDVEKEFIKNINIR